MSAYSINNKLVVETYKKESLKSEVRNGFATIDQKVNLKGLKLLVDAKLNDGTLLPKGSTVYVKEEYLHNPTSSATKILKCERIETNFIILDLTNVDLIDTNIC